MQLHFCESRSVWLRVVRPLFCLNKSLFQVENSLAAMQSIFVQPPSFHLGCEFHHNCSLCFYCWNDQPVYICPLLSKTFHVVQCLWTSVVATCSFDSTAACVLFAFSTSRGTLLAGFQEVGWGGGTGRVLGGSSREANILPPPCYHLLPPVVTNTIFKATHIFCQSDFWKILGRCFLRSELENREIGKKNQVELQLTEHFGDGGAAIWCELIVS